MNTRSARRFVGLLAGGLIGCTLLGCSGGTPQVDEAVTTPDPAVKPPPEPSPVMPSTSPATAGAASAPAPPPTSATDAPKP